jgi:hypothetical protein
MVKSKINKTLSYEETRGIFPEDVGEVSTIYGFEINGTEVAITLGKLRTDHSGVVYFPMYVIGDDKNGEPTLKGRIGLYEFEDKKALSLIDEMPDFEDPLLFSFVTPAYLKRMKSNPANYDTKTETKDTDTLKLAEEKKQVLATEGDAIDEALSIDITKKPVSVQKRNIDDKLEHGVFRNLKNFEKPLYLEEETEAMAADYRVQYRESANDPWIQRMMKNPNYDIKEVAANGDCLFDVIKEAYRSIGKETTIDVLRALVANDVSDTIFRDRKELYTILQEEHDNVMARLEKLKAVINDPITKAELAKKGLAKKKRDAMLKNINDKVEEYNQIVKTEYQFNKDNLDEFKFMASIGSIDDLRKYIMTSNFWADAWAISVLERVLNMKLIIFSEEDFDDGALDNIIHCGEAPSDDVEGSTTFNPEFYIMTTYSGNHYRLITYDERSVLTFREIPYDVKILIIKKCMEKNAGVYHLIPAFRDFKARLFLSDEPEPTTLGGGKSRSGSIVTISRDLFNPETTLIFGEKGSRRQPGKEEPDVLPSERLHEFSQLASVDHWRRKLDDGWEQAGDGGLFKLDGHAWKSVAHYMLGSRFKKGFPTIYLKFALSSSSNAAKDLYTARHAMNKEQTAITIDGVETTPVHFDAGFDTTIDENGVERKGRDAEEREAALTAKFTQNADLKAMLLYTRDALLLRFVKQSDPVPDEQLMRLRQSLYAAEAK